MHPPSPSYPPRRRFVAISLKRLGHQMDIFLKAKPLYQFFLYMRQLFKFFLSALLKRKNS
jgi:hypothetical protein